MGGFLRNLRLCSDSSNPSVVSRLGLLKEGALGSGLCTVFCLPEVVNVPAWLIAGVIREAAIKNRTDKKVIRERFMSLSDLISVRYIEGFQRVLQTNKLASKKQFATGGFGASYSDAANNRGEHGVVYGG